jgi:spore maturation protein CgeB
MSIKVAYVGLRYSYAKPEDGDSYEHRHIEAGLRSVPNIQTTFIYPDVDDVTDKIRSFVDHGGDVIFHVSFNEAYDLPEEAALYALNKGLNVIDWASDASWRFHNFILPRKHRYSHFITTHNSTIPWYQKNGMKVIKSQWGSSPRYWRDNNAEKKWPVSFLGQKHGIRPQLVYALHSAGVDLHLFGNYWEGFKNWHGNPIEFDEMIKVHHEAKICLNLSNPWHVHTLPQIKGRTFDIPAAAGFQICTPADNLEEYFIDGKEIVIATSLPDLIEKINYYLEHDVEREQIAEAGYKRVITEHSYSNRFKQIFNDLRTS